MISPFDGSAALAVKKMITKEIITKIITKMSTKMITQMITKMITKTITKMITKDECHDLVPFFLEPCGPRGCSSHPKCGVLVVTTLLFF